MTEWFAPSENTHHRRRRWLRMQLLVLAAVVVIIFVGSKIQQARRGQLVEFTHLDGGYSVLFPQHPVELCQLIDTPAGQIRRLRIQQRTRSSFYLVDYMDYPTDYIQQAGHAPLFDSAQHDLLSTSGGTLLNAESFTIGGHPARQLAIRAEGGSTIHALFVCAGPRVYEVAIEATSTCAESQASAVFDSFTMHPGIRN